MEIMNLQVLVMPNGEILCEGKTIGWKDKMEKYLSKEKKSIVIPFSESDLQDLESGEEFDWTFDGVDVHLRLETEEDIEA